MTRTVEHRFGSVAEFRANDDGSTVSFRGYATVYDVWYDVAGGPEAGGWRERILPGAATRTLNTNPLVHLLLNHEGLPLAATRSGTLLLEQDERGLMASAPSLDMANPKVQEARSVMARGDADAMSFAFRVPAGEQEWNADYTERTIKAFDLNVQGADVSLVTTPANPYTVAQIRSAAGIEEHRTPQGMSVEFARAVLDQIRSGAPR